MAPVYAGYFGSRKDEILKLISFSKREGVKGLQDMMKIDKEKVNSAASAASGIEGAFKNAGWVLSDTMKVSVDKIKGEFIKEEEG